MGEVADLYAALGLRIDQSAWARGDARIRGARKAVDDLHGAFQDRAGRWRAASGRFLSVSERAKVAARGIREMADAGAKAGRESSGWFGRLNSDLEGAGQRAAAVGTGIGVFLAYLGGRAVRAGVQFNSTMEGSKNQIAAMLALTKKTHLVDEMQNANTLVANLQQRAAKLPGTTAEYVAMLSNITRPIMDAKLGMQDLEDITVNSVVAAKAFGINAELAARDIDQALRGQYHSVDPFSGKVLGSLGYKGEEGRSRYNAMSEAKRASEFKRALLQPQIAELAAAQGNSFAGVMSTLQDAWEQFQGAVTKPLFEVLGASIKNVTKWLDENKAAVAELAEQIGGVLVAAFEIVSAAVKFFVEHGELAKALLIAIGSTLAGLAVLWIAGFWPIFVVIAAVTALILGVRRLIKHAEGVKAAFVAVWDAIVRAAGRVGDFFTKDIPNAIKAAFEWLSNLPVIGRLFRLVSDLRSLGAKDVPIVGPTGQFLGELAGKGVNAITGNRHLDDIDEIRTAPSLPPGRPGPLAMTVNVGGIGDIHVTSPNADPAAVALEVRRTFHEELGGVLRQTMDVVG